MRTLDHCIGGDRKLIAFWNMSDRTIIPNTEINKVLIAFCIEKYSPIRSNSPVLILSAHQKTKGRHLFTLHLNNYLRPNAGATLSNTPLMYLWLSSAPNTFATSIASLIATLYGTSGSN